MSETDAEQAVLARDGGEPVIPEPPVRDPRWGADELKRLTSMLSQDSLFYWSQNQPNTQTGALLEQFRRHYDFKYLMPCTSGSAAVHIAVAAAGIQPGDEVITSPLTDMGTVIGILYQQGVPVFADIDPDTFNIDPAAIGAKITNRTRAILPVHFSGNPCDMEAIMALARDHSLTVIEDCAQSWGAEYRGVPVGLIGDVACYSFNDFKHLSCGDGGIVGSNREDIGSLLQGYGDKGYARDGSSRSPKILAPNYRMSEPQAAIAAAQLEKLETIATGREWMGQFLDKALEGISGIQVPKRDTRDRHTYWFYTPKLDLKQFRCDRNTFVEALQAEGVLANAFTSPSPVYQWDVFQKHAFFGGGWPLREQGGTAMDYTQVHCPVTESLYDCWFRMILFEGMDTAYLENAARAIHKVAEHYR